MKLHLMVHSLTIAGLSLFGLKAYAESACLVPDITKKSASSCMTGEANLKLGAPMTLPSAQAKNVLGTELTQCGRDPVTGFYRDGSCKTGPQDAGTHTVCAVVTEEFLRFTQSRGNDLTTPRPQIGFPGLKPGQRWCLCASRWLEAFQAGVAPPVVLESTHEKTLSIIPIEALKRHSHTEE